MPSRSVQAFILIFWIAMTAWLLEREILPRMGFGELTYKAVLADRAVAEPTTWALTVNGERVGNILTLVEPREDGSHQLTARANVDGAIFGKLDERVSPGSAPSQVSRSPFPNFRVNSDIFVSAQGRLKRFNVQLGIEGANVTIHLEGVVRDNALELKASDLPILTGETTIPIQAEAMVFDQFGPLDRIPGLSVGKLWTTRAINPLAAAIAPSGWLGGAASALEVVRHEVTGVEPLAWKGKAYPCFVVEHRQDRTTAHSWVRCSDGRVLRQEVPIGGVNLTLEQDSVRDRERQ
ncbi:MAG: hypothetical protein U1D30_21340 [Planctomycetota bacterium]